MCKGGKRDKEDGDKECEIEIKKRRGMKELRKGGKWEGRGRGERKGEEVYRVKKGVGRKGEREEGGGKRVIMVTGCLREEEGDKKERQEKCGVEDREEKWM